MNNENRYIARAFVLLVSALGFASISSKLSVALSNTNIGMTTYKYLMFFEGVPGSFIAPSGVFSSGSSDFLFLSSGILAIILVFIFYFLTDRIITKIEQSFLVKFVTSYILLCCSNLVVSYFGAFLGMPYLFSNSVPSHGMTTKTIVALAILLLQCVMTLVFYRFWWRRLAPK